MYNKNDIILSFFDKKFPFFLKDRAFLLPVFVKSG